MEYYFGFAKELLDQDLARVNNPYGKNNLYDLTIQFNYDLDFYLDLANGKRHILDIGCGTGRILLPLLKNGLNVVGMDNSKDMLQICRDKCLAYGFKPQLFQEDMRDFDLQDKFDLIMIPYHSLMYMLTDEDRLKVFRSIYKHLDNGGLLAFDFDTSLIPRHDTIPALALQGIHPLTGEIMVQVIQIRGLDENLRLLNQINYFFGKDQRITVEYSLESTISVKHMESLLGRVGFHIQAIYGDYRGGKYQGGNECIMVAGKK